MADFGYSARIPASAMPVHVRRQPGAGAAIAQGLQQLGGAVSRVSYQDQQVKEQVAESEARIEEIETRRWRATTGATLMTRYSDLQLELDAKLEDLRKSVPPGAQGHEQAVREATDEMLGKFLSEIPDDEELQNKFRPLAANLTARTVMGERTWEQQARAKHIASSWEQWETTASGQLYAKPSGESFHAFMAEGEAAIELTDTDQTTKAAMREQLKAVGTRALFTGLIDGGRQDVVRAAIEAGEFDAVLDDKAKSNWLQRAAQADRIANAEVEAAQSAARSEALENAKLIEVRINAGEDVPPADAQAAYQAMVDAGVKPSEYEEFRFMAEDAIVAQSLRGYATPQLQERRATLQAKADAGKATAAEKREIGLIDDHLKGRTTREADDLGKLWKGTPEQRMEALGRARQLPADQRLAATSQVSTQMQLLTVLSPRNQVLAVQGSEIRADRPEDFLPEPSGRNAKGEDVVRAVMREYLGDTINEVGGITDDMMGAALDLMAGSRVSNKREKGWHKGDFLAALRAVTGGTQRSDGTWQGGIGTFEGFRVELPANVSEQEFARGVSRLPFDDANYADGRKAAKADILRFFRPVYVETDSKGRAVYVMQGRGGLLLHGDEPYRVHVGAPK